MKLSNNFLFELRKSLNNDVLPWVVSALQHDPLIWYSLQNEFSGISFEKERNQPDDWSPASLSLLALNVPIQIQQLKKTPLEVLPSQLRKKAVKEFEHWKYDDKVPPHNLKKAGLLALALRERLRFIGNWNSFLKEIDPERHTIEAIGTPLACLYGMIPNPDDLILSTLPNFDLAIHILLSNPIRPDALIDFFKSILESLSSENHIVFLKSLNPFRPTITSELARHLLNSNRTEHSADSSDDINYLTRLHQLAKQPNQAIPFLTTIIEETRHNQASYLAQLAKGFFESGDNNAGLDALEQAHKLNPSSEGLLTGWITALIDNGQVDKAQSIIQEKNEILSSNPEFLILKTRLAINERMFDQARQNAVLALESLNLPQSNNDNGKELQNKTSNLLNSPISKELAAELTELFFELNLCNLGVKSAQFALKTDPTNPKLIRQLSRAYRFSGESQNAIASAHLALTLEPQNLDNHHFFAETLEVTGEWSKALNERELIFRKQENLNPSEVTKEMKSLARCAMKAKNFDRAREVCEGLLSINPEDGIAHTLLGDTLYYMGDHDSAQEHYQLATQYSPKFPEPWLAMARNHLREKQPEKAIEILRTASHATPDNPKILVELGKIYLDQKSTTQSLDVLKRASENISVKDDPDLYLENEYNLGQALYELGHLKEAEERLNKAYNSLPAEPSLAQLYAQILLELDETKAALTPLARIVQTNPGTPQPYITYADTLIKVEESPVEAIPPLQKAIEYSSEGSYEHFMAQALMADALRAIGDLEKAQNFFEKILENEHINNLEWRVRVPLGLARTILASGHHDRAIAIMEELTQIEPKNPKIYYHLAEAFQRANLHKNAYNAALSSMNLNPNDLDTLIWFSELVLNILGAESFESQERRQKEMEAIEALNRATQLEPDHIDLYAKLADALLKTDNKSEAWNTYLKVLTFDTSKTPSSKSIPALKNAASGFIQLGDPSNAVTSIEKAIELTSKPDTDLLIALAQAQLQAGHPQQALNILKDATEDLPNHIDFHLQKIDLLVELKRPQAALAALENAMNLNPGSPKLRMRAANLMRTLGDLPKALEYAESVVELENPKTNYLAADIARSMLNPKRSCQILGSDAQDVAKKAVLENMNDLEILDYICLCAELALESDDNNHINYLEKIQASEAAKKHPRSIVLSARITLRKGDFYKAIQKLDHALQKASIHLNEEGLYEIQPDEETDPSLLLAICDAALEFGRWDLAVYLAENVVEKTPHELRAQMTLATALVLRAEIYKLCKNLDVINNAPSEDSRSKNAYQLFLKAIETSKRFANDEKQIKTISHWELRGESSFNGKLRTTQTLVDLCEEKNKTPTEIASCSATLRHMGHTGIIREISSRFPANPHVQTQVLLALADEKPEEALQIAETISNHHAVHGRMGITQPLLYNLIANVAFKTNHISVAQKTILKALDIWEDEPRWNELAAKIHSSLVGQDEASHIQTAIDHLKRAIEIEPERVSYWLELGKIYLNQNMIKEAIQMLEKATEIAEALPEPWYYLAQAQLANRDLTQASLCADRAISLDSDQARSLILRAEIALEANDPEVAYKLTKDALQLQPNNPDILVLLTRGLEALGRPEDALKALEIGLETLPNTLLLLMERVRLIRGYKSLEEALEALQYIAQEHPNDPKVLSWLAETLAEAGKVDSSIHIAQRALKSAEGILSEPEKSHLHFLLGKLMRRKGQLDQAVHHLNQATEHVPKRLESYIELGLVHQDRRELEEALKAFENAISIAPQDHRPYYYAGIAFKESKDYQNAEEMLRRAAELNPSEVRVQRQLGALVALNIVHGRV